MNKFKYISCKIVGDFLSFLYGSNIKVTSTTLYMKLCTFSLKKNSTLYDLVCITCIEKIIISSIKFALKNVRKFSYIYMKIIARNEFL